MKDYHVFFIVGAFLIGISAILVVYSITTFSKINEFCHPKFPPENSTKTLEQYDHCMYYPETYGYGKK